MVFGEAVEGKLTQLVSDKNCRNVIADVNLNLVVQY